MLISAIAAEVVRTQTAHAIRPRRNVEVKKGDMIEYDAQPYFSTGKKKGWTILDLFTASMLVQIHAALNEKSRTTWDTIPLYKLISFGWSITK